MSVYLAEASKIESAITCDVGESNRVVKVTKFEHRHHRVLDGSTESRIVTARFCRAVSPIRLDVIELRGLRDCGHIYIYTTRMLQCCTAIHRVIPSVTLLLSL